MNREEHLELLKDYYWGEEEIDNLSDIFGMQVYTEEFRNHAEFIEQVVGEYYEDVGEMPTR